MQGGLVNALMGENVTLPIENKLKYICAGGSDQATWAIFNCSRNIKQTDASGGQEWQDESEERGPYFVTYACLEGESLSPERNFVKDLGNYFREIFIKN